MKKLSLLLAAVLFASSILAGCSSGTSSGGGTSQEAAASSSEEAQGQEQTTDGEIPEVKVWIKKSFSEEADDALAERLKEFGTTTGKCTVSVEFIPNANFGEKYAAAVESGEVPDVAFMTLYLLRQYYDNGLMMEISDVVDSVEESGHALSEKAKSAATFDGGLYAVPYYLNGAAMFYRTDYLAQAGWDEPPTTWDEVRQCAKDVTEKVEGVYGLGFGFGKCPDTENNGRSALFSLGGHIFDEEGNLSLTAPETVEALQWISDMYLVDGSIPPTAVNWDDSGNNTAFLSGQVAMIFNAASLTMELQKEENAEFAANVGVADMPAGPSGTLICNGPQYLSIFKNAKNPELAKELLQFNMDYDWYKGWVDEMKYGVQPAYEDIVYDDPYITPYIHSNENSVWQGYPGPYTGIAAQAWSAFKLTDVFQRILVDQVPVEQAAAEIQEQIRELE